MDQISRRTGKGGAGVWNEEGWMICRNPFVVKHSDNNAGGKKEEENCSRMFKNKKEVELAN